MRKRLDLTTLRLRLIMVAALLFDLVVTLFSQPENWKIHPENAFESNMLFHFFLVQAWQSILFYF